LSIKQYIKGKPTPWGIKNFLLCGQSGIVYNSLLYQGSNTNINDFMQKNYGLGGAVVLKLVENLKPDSHNLFFDNFFSSYNLFGCLLKYKIFAIGTIRCNRFCNPPFPKDKELAKMGRGTSFEVSSNHNITLVKWFDNKAVNIGSNFIASGIPIQVKRFDRKEKCSVIIECPEIINLYNKNMGGVDKHDQLVSYYRTFIKSKKWTLRMMFHIFDMAVVNCWLEYKRDAAELSIEPKDVMDWLHFKRRLGESLISVGVPFSPSSKKRGRPSNSPSIINPQKKLVKKVDEKPLEEVKKDSYGHFPEYDDRTEAVRCKVEGCKGRTHVYCLKCKCHLCFTKKNNCFLKFHT